MSTMNQFSTNTRPRGASRLVINLIAAIGLVIGFIAVAPAGASAQAAPGSIAFVNGFDVTRFIAVVDPGTEAEQEIDLKELRTIGAVDVSPGSHTVQIFEGQSATGSAVATRTVTVESGESATLAVHPSPTGTIATSKYANLDEPTGSSTSRLVVRHVGQAGAVTVDLQPSSSSSNASEGTTTTFELANGQQGVEAGVVAMENLTYELTITPVGASSPLIVDTEVTFSPGVEQVIYIAGSPPQGENAQDPESLLQRERQVGALPPPVVNLVNGFSENTNPAISNQFVFYVDGTQGASIEPLRRNGALQGLSEGTFTVEAYRNSSTPGSGSPAASIEIGVCDGQSYDLAIHPDATGGDTMTFFENDVTTVGSQSTRFTVRHIAQNGPVDVQFGSNGENSGPATSADFTLANGEERVIDDAIVNDYQADAFNTGTTSGAVARQPDFEGEGGATQIGYIMGSPPGVAEPLQQYFPYAGEPVIPTSNAPGSECTSGVGGTGGGGTGGGGTGGSGGSGSDSIGNVFTAVEPFRVLDTREPTLGHDGKLSSGESIVVDVAGVGDVPSDGVSAVVVNLTAADTDGSGFLSATPTTVQGDPETSNVNFTAAGQNRATMTTVPLADDGSFSIYGLGGAHAVADVLGYYTPVDDATSAGRFVPLQPSRFFDTRTGAAPSGTIPAGGSIDVPVLGLGDVPSDGVSAVVFNLTATEAAAPGWLAATPGGVAASNTSSLNYTTADIAVANQVVVPVGSGGDVRISSLSETHALGDVLGYFTDDTAAASESGLFVPVDPSRVFDTRVGDGVPQGQLQPGTALDVSMTAELGVSGSEAGAVAINLTALNNPGATFLSVNPSGSTSVSTLNLNPNDIRANSAYTAIQSDGTVSVVANGSVDALADITGWFRR